MGIFAYFAICVFWGLSTVAVKLGLENIELFSFNFLRFITTGMILILYNLLRRKSILISREDFKVVLISATAMFFLNSTFIALATERLDAGIVPIVLSLVPIVMVVIESILERKVLVSPIGMTGIAGGILGIVIISFGNSLGAGMDLKGLAFLATGIMCWSSGSLYLRRKRINASISVLLMYQALIPLVYYSAIILFKGGLVYELSAASFGGMLYMGIVDTIIGSACYIYLLKNWKISVVSTYAYVNPVVGLLGAYLILGETVSAQKIQGMVVILISVYLIQSDEKLRSKLSRLRKNKPDKLS